MLSIGHYMGRADNLRSHPVKLEVLTCPDGRDNDFTQGEWLERLRNETARHYYEHSPTYFKGNQVTDDKISLCEMLSTT